MADYITGEEGFTLVELLVVILIIGLLAAIAIPSFLSQREKGQDSDAKENAANLARLVQACYTETQDYSECNNADLELHESTGLPLGGSPGQVQAVNPSSNELQVDAFSRSGATFSVVVVAGSPTLARVCTGDTAGCRGGKW